MQEKKLQAGLKKLVVDEQYQLWRYKLLSHQQFIRMTHRTSVPVNKWNLDIYTESENSACFLDEEKQNYVYLIKSMTYSERSN